MVRCTWTMCIVNLEGSVVQNVMLRAVRLQPKARITGNVNYRALEMRKGYMIAGRLFPAAVLVEEKPPLKLASNNP